MHIFHKRDIVGEVSLWALYLSGASLVGSGSGGWRKETLWGISYLCAFWNWWEEQIWTPPWVCYPGLFARKWSLWPDLTSEVPRLLRLLCFATLPWFCFYFLSFICAKSSPLSLPPTVLSCCCLFVTHLKALNRLPICHILPCKVYLSFSETELTWHAQCFHKISFLCSVNPYLLSLHFMTDTFSPGFYWAFIMFWYAHISLTVSLLLPLHFNTPSSLPLSSRWVERLFWV